MGLLDEDFYDDPQRLGLMQAGAGLLGAGDANSRALSGMFGGLVRGGQQAHQFKRQKEQDQAQQAFQALKMRAMQGDLQAEEQARAMQSRINDALRPEAQEAPQGIPAQPGMAAPQQPQDPMVSALQREMMVRKNMGDHAGAASIFNKLTEMSKVKETRSFLVDGKPRRMSMNAQGQWSAPSEYEEAHELKFLNNGKTHDAVSSFTGAPQASFPIVQSADSEATERSTKARVGLGYSQIKAAKERQAAGGGGGDASLPDDVAEQMAEQAMAGDSSVFQNLGRGAQGAANIIKIRSLIARRTAEAGENGSDRAAKNAEYFGTKAGQHSAGMRIANVEMAVSEAQELVPLARQASSAVVRSGFLPFGKAQMFVDNKTNSPEMRQFVAANNAMVNVYSRAISPTGKPTVSDKEHARELLQTAYDDKSYQAVLDQMNLEMEAARKAPKTVRREFSESVTGRHGPAVKPQSEAKPMAALPAPNASNKGKTVRDTETGKRWRNTTGMKWEEI